MCLRWVCMFQLWLLMSLLLLLFSILIWRLCCYVISAFGCNAQRNYPHSSFWATAVNLFSLQLSKDRWWWWYGMVMLAAILAFFNLLWCMSSVCTVQCTAKIKAENSMKKGSQSIWKRAINTKLHKITNAFLLKCKCSSALWYARNRCTIIVHIDCYRRLFFFWNSVFVAVSILNRIDGGMVFVKAI